MENRLAELEIRFMEQEHTLDALNRQVYLQQQEITQLIRELEIVKDRLKSMAHSPLASAAEETPPPHY